MEYKIGDKIYYERNGFTSARPNGVYTVRSVSPKYVLIDEDAGVAYNKHIRPYTFKPRQKFNMRHGFPFSPFNVNKLR
jgi:hypothetical protein